MRILLQRFPSYPREIDLGWFQANEFQHLELALVVSSLSLWAFNHTDEDPLLWGAALVGGQAGRSSEDTRICGYMPPSAGPGHLGKPKRL